MDEPNDYPRILANRIIQQMVEHMIADAPEVKPEDFLVLRTVFRAAGGGWIAITEGDTKQLDLLKDFVTAWGALQPAKTQKDFV